MIRNKYIKRLKERLREKPDSRLFLSLAEELKKDDKLNEAIDVLIGGIRKVPDFDAARLTLGRWYLQSNMLSEAKKEFSEVLRHSPNNIFAIKWLNKINSQLGSQHSNKEQVLHRLNTFLNAIRDRFEDMPDVRPACACLPVLRQTGLHADRDKNSVINRLNKFLEAVKTRFAASPI